ncbi:MAG: hypothetical protein QOE57_528 [Acidimicrobiaceae bacterium]|nr:hypothetical protein [Acidimicrobiaceae bacterium]
MGVSESVGAAARAFVRTLDEDQSQTALLPFDEGERRTWAYWPTSRRGVPLSTLDRPQTKASHRLLAALLPLPAYARVVTIMGLEEVLDRLEGYPGDRRHSGDYWMTMFGQPGAEMWGVRFEGHHVSIHASFCGGDARLTPLFLGANPARIDDGGHPVVAPLAPEEELGFELLHALTTEERAAAVVADEAPKDIVTRNLPRLDPPPTLGREGLPLSVLRASAAACATALLDVYLGRFPPGVLRPDARNATFAWAGASEPGEGHYYRIAGPRLLIELDNTQNGANHVHTVVRDPAGDFGDDVLRAHHQQAHPAM